MTDARNTREVLDPEDDVRLSIDELSRCCRCSVELIVTLVQEGAIEPQGDAPAEWRFADAALRRTLRAVRLSRELEINPPGVALALDLMDKIDRLEAAFAMTAFGRGNARER